MKKPILFVIGLISLSFGALGIFLPVLPTTPFVLLSAGCFSVSSPRLASMIRKNKYFGSYIENYQNKTGVPRKVKYSAILYLWVGLIVSMFITKEPLIILILSIVGIAVSVHLVTLKTKNKKEEK